MPPPPLLLAKETADITMMNIISAMDDLYVFDGNNKLDRVDRVAIDYHRVTKIKPKIIPARCNLGVCHLGLLRKTGA